MNFQEAATRWAADRLVKPKHQHILACGLDPLRTEIRFEGMQGGYCETCEYVTTAISFKVECNCGRSTLRDFEERSGGVGLADIVKEFLDEE